MSLSQELRADVAEPAVKLSGITKRFNGHAVIKHLNLEIKQGEFVALLGASGSGKTTLLRLVSGLESPDEGQIVVPQTISTVFQEPRLMPWKRVLQNVALGVRAKDAKAQALQALAEVGLSHRVDAFPATLSGGEAQRVALARGLIRHPKLFLLDEPFAALDALTRIRMHSLLLELWGRHKPAVLLVTHDIQEAILLADRVLVLVDGKVEQDINIAWARPRLQGSAEFDDMRKRLLALLGVFDHVPETLSRHYDVALGQDHA